MIIRILFVDDYANTRKAYKKRLELDLGAKVWTVKGAAEAREIVSKYPLDLVITDLELEGENGFDLVDYVKGLSPATKVIIFTAVPGSDKGAADLRIAKPMPRDFVGRVRELLC